MFSACILVRLLRENPRSGRCGLIVRAVVLLSGVLLMLTSPQARAGTIRADRNDSLYTALANQDEFASVGEFNWKYNGSNYLASGTLIDHQWVLTAAHVVEDITSSNIGTMTFTLGGETFYVEETFYHSGWTGSTNGGNDIGLVKLSTAVVGVAPSLLYEYTDENRQITTVVGYGMTGTGISGAIDSAGTKRAGTNVVGLGSVLNTLYGSGSGNDNMLVADFDQPGTTGDPTVSLGVPTDLEYCGASGDSGGGWFLEADGQYYLAGVTSFLISNNVTDSMYGDIFGAVRVSSYISWIEENADFSDPLPGDADNDYDVDADDAAVLAANWLQSGDWSDGDFNDDGMVNDLDAAIMSANWTAGAALASVPEPGAWALLAGLFGCGIWGKVGEANRLIALLCYFNHIFHHGIFPHDYRRLQTEKSGCTAGSFSLSNLR